MFENFQIYQSNRKIITYQQLIYFFICSQENLDPQTVIEKLGNWGQKGAKTFRKITSVIKHPIFTYNSKPKSQETISKRQALQVNFNERYHPMQYAPNYQPNMIKNRNIEQIVILFKNLKLLQQDQNKVSTQIWKLRKEKSDLEDELPKYDQQSSRYKSNKIIINEIDNQIQELCKERNEYKQLIKETQEQLLQIFQKKPGQPIFNNTKNPFSRFNDHI